MWKCIEKIVQIGDDVVWVRVKFSLATEGKILGGTATLHMYEPDCPYELDGVYTSLPAAHVVRAKALPHEPKHEPKVKVK